MCGERGREKEAILRWRNEDDDDDDDDDAWRRKKKKEQRAVGSCVLLDGSMKRRDRDATLYPGGWRGKKGGKNTGGIVAAKLRMGRECTLR